MWLPSLVARLFGESGAHKGRPYRNYRGWFGVQRLSAPPAGARAPRTESVSPASSRPCALRAPAGGTPARPDRADRTPAPRCPAVVTSTNRNNFCRGNPCGCPPSSPSRSGNRAPTRGAPTGVIAVGSGCSACRRRQPVRGLRGPSPSRPHLRILARFERLPAGRPRARIGQTELQRPAAPPSSPARTATISVGATLVVALPRRPPVQGIGRPQGAPLQELSRLVRGAAPVGAAARCAGSADRVRPARIFESLRASSACRRDARAPGSGRPDSSAPLPRRRHQHGPQQFL